MRTLYSSLLLAIACASVSAQAAPPILVQATQCLAARAFFARDTRPSFEFGYWIDTQSYPGQQMMYIVDFLHKDGREGQVFTVFVQPKQGGSSFDIQNNGRFKVSASGESIDFPEEILGGIWTHEHVESAIRRIERQPRFSISREVVFGKPDVDSCRSYADPGNSQ